MTQVTFEVVVFVESKTKISVAPNQTKSTSHPLFGSDLLMSFCSDLQATLVHAFSSDARIPEGISGMATLFCSKDGSALLDHTLEKQVAFFTPVVQDFVVSVFSEFERIDRHVDVYRLATISVVSCGHYNQEIELIPEGAPHMGLAVELKEYRDIARETRSVYLNRKYLPEVAKEVDKLKQLYKDLQRVRSSRSSLEIFMGFQFVDQKPDGESLIDRVQRFLESD